MFDTIELGQCDTNPSDLFRPSLKLSFNSDLAMVIVAELVSAFKTIIRSPETTEAAY